MPKDQALLHLDTLLEAALLHRPTAWLHSGEIQALRRALEQADGLDKVFEKHIAPKKEIEKPSKLLKNKKKFIQNNIIWFDLDQRSFFHPP